MTHLPSGVAFEVSLWDTPPGKHGFHVHRSGNLTKGSHSLCDHYHSPGKTHGGLNDFYGHEGDLGNLEVNKHGECNTKFVARYLSLDSIIGRSLVVHDQEDDLGLGSYPDSHKTGHSGGRLYYGIIARDESCDDNSGNASRPSDNSSECVLL